jgi:serine/threonine-protein phosphatase 2A regulatory subunit B''
VSMAADAQQLSYAMDCCYGSARMKMDELFVLWLGQKGTHVMIRGMLDAAVSGKPIERPAAASLLAALSSPSSSSASMSPGGSGQLRSPGHSHALQHGYSQQPPPRSPTAKQSGVWSPKSSTGGRSGRQRSLDRFLSPEKRSHSRGSSVSDGSVKKVSTPSPQRTQKLVIPPFYVPGEGGRGRGRPLEGGNFEFRRAEIMAIFGQHPEGVSVDDFVPVTKTLCGFPSFFNAVLFRRIRSTCSLVGGSASPPVTSPGSASPVERVTLEQFAAFWRSEIEPYDLIERFFRIVKQPGCEYIGRDDFAPFIAELLMYHPGLEFLENHPDFHPKYSATVTARIFYSVNTAGDGRITQRELRRSSLVTMFNVVDEEEDINKVIAC